MQEDPKSIKFTEDVTVFFALLGYALVKAAGKHVGEFDSGVNFINIILAHFSYEIFGSKTSNPKFFTNFFSPKFCTKNGRVNMSVKSTPDLLAKKLLFRHFWRNEVVDGISPISFAP